MTELNRNTRDLGLIPGSGRSLEKGMATHSSILVWRIPEDRGAWGKIPKGLLWSKTSNHSRDLNDSDGSSSPCQQLSYMPYKD